LCANVTRRAWLAGALAASLGTESRGVEDDDQEARSVEEGLKKAGLEPIRSLRSKNYLVVGNADEVFLRLILRDCEAVSAAYLDHFRAKGFDVSRPARLLTVVALAGYKSFLTYLKTTMNPDSPALRPDPVSVHNGVYRKRTNRLIIFKQATGNTTLSVLCHELTHQLTYNTGLLDARSDVPLCINEGLGTYGEARRLNVPPAPGQRNSERLENLARAQRQPRVAWIKVADLLADDGILRGESGNYREVLAYSESWLLVYFLLNQPTRLPGFRRYLEAIRARRDRSSRLQDATTHWGDLDRFDKDLHQFAIQMLKST
jgi:hypothetical protein